MNFLLQFLHNERQLVLIHLIIGREILTNLLALVMVFFLIHLLTFQLLNYLFKILNYRLLLFDGFITLLL